jgi:hypothetical protein
MKVFRIFTLLVLLAALTALTFPTFAACPDGDPDPPLAPPISHQVSSVSFTADLTIGTLAAPGALSPLDFTVPPPVTVDPLPFLEPSQMPPAFEALPVRARFQDPSDVSCGVQALGMALDGLGGGAPSSAALTGFLQGNGMMYDFGTGVEELTLAAHAFGYKGSLPFYGWTLEDLKTDLNAGHPVVVSLGSNGEHQPGHFVTVTGISPDEQWISYNDPTLGKQVVRTEAFLTGWALQGNSGVQVATTPAPEAGPIDYTPWVVLAAVVMALISQTPLGMFRKGIGGFLDPGYGAGPSSSYKPPMKSSPPKKVTTKKKVKATISKTYPKPIVTSKSSKKVTTVKKKAKKKTSKPSSKPVIVPDPVEELSILKPKKSVMPSTTVDEPPQPPSYEDKLTKFEELYLDPVIPEPIAPSSDVITPSTTPSVEIIPTVTPSPTPEYKPIATPTWEELEKRRKALEKERAERLESARREYLETEPLQYIREYVYWANGLDYFKAVEERQNNPLTLEMLNDNKFYPPSARAATVMTANDAVNQKFVEVLFLDTTHFPNYEPVYFDELKRQFSVLYQQIEKSEYTEEGEPIYTWGDILARQIYRLLGFFPTK